MNEHQFKAYEAVCSADPDCRCPLVYGEVDAWLYRFTSHCVAHVPEALAAAAITNHLRNRNAIELSDETEVTDCPIVVYDHATGPDHWMVICEDTDMLFPDPLSAYLAAHIVRLSLPRELIQKMEEA